MELEMQLHFDHSYWSNISMQSLRDIKKDSTVLPSSHLIYQQGLLLQTYNKHLTVESEDQIHLMPSDVGFSFQQQQQQSMKHKVFSNRQKLMQLWKVVRVNYIMSQLRL